MNWQDDLLKKSQELKIKGGQNGISNRSNIRNNSRSRNSTRNSISSKNRKDINTDKGKEEKLMITREAALDDLQKLEKEATDKVSKVIIEVARVIIKMLATIRSNQLLTDADKVAIKKAREARKSKQSEKEQ